MHACIHAYINTYIYIHTYIHTCIRIHTSIHTYIYANIHAAYIEYIYTLIVMTVVLCYLALTFLKVFLIVQNRAS